MERFSVCVALIQTPLISEHSSNWYNIFSHSVTWQRHIPSPAIRHSSPPYPFTNAANTSLKCWQLLAHQVDQIWYQWWATNSRTPSPIRSIQSTTTTQPSTQNQLRSFSTCTDSIAQASTLLISGIGPLRNCTESTCTPSISSTSANPRADTGDTSPPLRIW